MKALVLAAGRGTRMDHLTDDRPKPLINIKGKPFLHYVLESIRKAGIEDIGIVVGYKKEMVEEYFKSRSYSSDPGLKLTFIDQKEQLGTGHAIKTGKQWSSGNGFVVMMGDNIYSPNDIKSISNDDAYCYAAGFKHEHPERFGVLMTSGNHLDGIVEKPSNPKSNMVNTGLYKFTPEIFSALDRIGKSERGEYEITDAINLLCKDDKVRLIRIQDYWVNFGRPEDIPGVEDFIGSRSDA